MRESELIMWAWFIINHAFFIDQSTTGRYEKENNETIADIGAGGNGHQ